jgi:DNA-binding XRE family transcriptional regulator
VNLVIWEFYLIPVSYTFEKNKYSPSLALAFRIARVFGMPLDEVFQYQGGLV